MKDVYRISAPPDAIMVEHWPGWAAFDAKPPTRSTARADIAYAATPQDGMVTTAGLHELAHIRVGNGRMADVRALLAGDLRAWSAAGAKAIGAFTMVHGDDIPACLILLAWPSLQAALSGQIAFETDAAVIEARRANRLARGQASIRGTERLFRPRLTVTAIP
jgi:hypothetical protein